MLIFQVFMRKIRQCVTIGSMSRPTCGAYITVTKANVCYVKRKGKKNEIVNKEKRGRHVTSIKLYCACFNLSPIRQFKWLPMDSTSYFVQTQYSCAQSKVNLFIKVIVLMNEIKAVSNGNILQVLLSPGSFP